MNDTDKAASVPQPSGRQEPAFELRTYIFGRNAASMSDDEIFEKVRGVENEIKSLQAINAPSEKLKGKIESLKTQISALVQYVDQRK